MQSDKTFGTREQNAHYTDREGAYLITIKEGLLPIISAKTGLFLLGGGLSQGESHKDCIVRECLEEAGLRVAVGKYMFTYDTYCVYGRHGHIHPIQHYYSGEVLRQLDIKTDNDTTLIWEKPISIMGRFAIPQQEQAVIRFLRNRA